MKTIPKGWYNKEVIFVRPINQEVFLFATFNECAPQVSYWIDINGYRTMVTRQFFTDVTKDCENIKYERYDYIESGFQSKSIYVDTNGEIFDDLNILKNKPQ